MILIILFSFLLLFAPLSPSYAINIQAGENAPDFFLSSINGDSVSLSDYKGKVVVLIYWRPDQKRSHTALKDGNYFFHTFKNKGVQIIGLIAKPDNMDNVQKIIKDNKIDFPVLIDTERDIFSGYGIRVYPSTIIVNRDGKVAFSIPGHAINYKITVEAHLKKILGEITDEKLKDILSPHRKKIDKSHLKSERMYNLALKFSDSNLIDMAADAARQSIEMQPDNARFHILLGFLLLAQKETDDALEQFNRALEILPESHDAKTGLGKSLLIKGDIDRAIEVLTEASVANPYSVITYFELGKAYELKGEKDSSIEMYKKALNRATKNIILPSSIRK